MSNTKWGKVNVLRDMEACLTSEMELVHITWGIKEGFLEKVAFEIHFEWSKFGVKSILDNAYGRFGEQWVGSFT